MASSKRARRLRRQARRKRSTKQALSKPAVEAQLPEVPEPVLQASPAPPELLTAEVFEALLEKLGDEPKWLRITAYKEAYDPAQKRTKSELFLNLRGKDYWFPLSPLVYDNFLELALHQDRGQGLRYLQKYIRSHRQYKGRWPSKRYVRRNQLPGGKSLMHEGELTRRRPRRATSQVVDYQDCAARLGLSPEQVEAIHDAYLRGAELSEVAQELGISLPHVTSTLTLIRGFADDDLSDSLISSVAEGLVSVDEAVEKLAGEARASKAAFAATGNPKGRLKPLRATPGVRANPKARLRPSSPW